MRHVNRNPVVGKVARFRVDRRYRGSLSAIGAVAKPLVGSKEKQFVFDYLAARGAAKLVAPERRLGSSGVAVDVVEVIFGIQCIIAQEIVRRAVKLIRSAFSNGIDLRRAATVLRGIGIGLYLEFLDLVNGGDGRDRVGIRRCVYPTVQKVIDILGARAAQRVLIFRSSPDAARVLKPGVAVLGKRHSWPKRRQTQKR